MGDVSDIKLIRTDTFFVHFDLSQKAEKRCCFFPRGELLYDLIQFITGVFLKTASLSYFSPKFTSRGLPNNLAFNVHFARLGEQIFNLHLYS